MDSSQQHPLLMIGCGHMGRALVTGWCRKALDPAHLVVIDRHPERLDALRKDTGFRVAASLDDVEGLAPAAICLAVKPAGLEALLPQLAARLAGVKPLVLSVIAGRGLSYYETALWPQAALIRMMPNTPVAVGEGISGCFANAAVTPAQRGWADTLMRAVGEVIWLSDEAQMHALTAISGSGPAYVFYLMECLMDVAAREGFSEAEARLLVAQTFYGAAQMARDADEPVSQLRKAVTSPNGTTQAGLNVLMDAAPEALFRRTVEAAKNRSIELAT